MEKIVIYTNKSCPYCKSVKEYLKTQDVEFEEKLIEDIKEEWNQVNNLTSVATVPTIYYKNNYFVAGRDFPSPQLLVNILKDFKESNFSEARRSLEAVKTLNMNIAQAFTRLDQRLTQIENKLNTEENGNKSTS